MNAALREQLRNASGREAQPSAGIIDSQSVKTTEVRGERGYDAGKKVKGRKRHILVDTMGLLLMVLVHPANIQDRPACACLCRARLPVRGTQTGQTGEAMIYIAMVHLMVRRLAAHKAAEKTPRNREKRKERKFDKAA